MDLVASQVSLDSPVRVHSRGPLHLDSKLTELTHPSASPVGQDMYHCFFTDARRAAPAANTTTREAHLAERSVEVEVEEMEAMGETETAVPNTGIAEVTAAEEAQRAGDTECLAGCSHCRPLRHTPQAGCTETGSRSGSQDSRSTKDSRSASIA